MAERLPVNLGVDGLRILEQAAVDRGVSVQDLVRSGLEAVGVTLPKLWAQAPRKPKERAGSTIWVLLKQEGHESLSRVAQQRHHTKAQMVRVGLEAIGIVLPPARPVGNPRGNPHWRGRKNGG